MSRSTVVRFPLGDDPRDAVYAVRLTGSGLAQDYLCLQYLVFPVPPELVDDHAMHEGDHAGLAIHGSHVDRKCRSGYRTSANGNCVVGAVKIGPAAWPAFGRIAVLFAPFAHSSSLRHILCEVRLIVEDGQVRGAQIRSHR